MPAGETSVKPIHPTDDVRVTHEFAILNGRKYHYVNGLPKEKQKGVVLLLHGFPDLWYTWRNTIPFLLDLGFRIIAPDLLGYGQTDKPVATGEDLVIYSQKSMCADLAELLKQLDIPKVISIGHDWGSYTAQRLAYFHPNLVSHVAVISVPFTPLQTHNLSVEDLVKIAPNFKYQLSIIDPEKFEKRLTERSAVDRLLRAFFRPKPSTPRKPGELSKINSSDSLLDGLPDVPRSDIITEEDLQYYVDNFTKGGFHGPSNWYRTREYSYKDEKDLPNKTIDVPGLFIQTLHDAALPPQFIDAIPQHLIVPNLTRRQVDTEHWAMEEDPEAVNAILKEWFTGVVLGGNPKL